MSTYAGNYYIDTLFDSQYNTLKVIGKSLKENSICRIEAYEFFPILLGGKSAYISDRRYLVSFQEAYFLSDDDFFMEMFAIPM